MSSALDSLQGLARSAAVVFVGTVVARGLGLVGEVLIVRSLSPAAFGTVALAYTTVLTLSRVGLLGVPAGVSRLMAAEDDVADQQSVLRSGYVLALVAGGALAVGLYALRQEIAALMGDSGIAPLAALFVPFVLISPVSRVSVAGLRARKRSAAMVVSRNVAPRAAAILLFLAFAWLERPYHGAVAYWLVLPLVTVSLAVVFLWRELPLASTLLSRPDRASIRNLWSFSWPLAVSSSLVVLMANFDVLMTGYFLDPDAVGFYRSVQPLRQVTQFVLQSFVFLFLPLATEFYADGALDDLRDFYTVSSKWVALLTLPLVLVFSLFAADVVRVFFGNEYLPASAALAVLTSGLFFNALVGPNGAMLKAVNRPRVEMYAATLGVVVNVVLNTVLIPVVGIIGAAAATVAGYVVFNTFEGAFIYRITGAHPFSLATLGPLAVTTAVAAGVAWLTAGVVLGLPALLAVGVGLVVVQGVAVLVTGGYDDADVALVRRACELVDAGR